MFLKIGLEKEFFLLKEDAPVLVPPGIPHDDCGWLVEARGEPYPDVFQAVYSLRANAASIEDRIKGMTMTDTPVMKIPKSLRLQAGRIYVKGLAQYQNLYGFEDHLLKGEESSAGVHISFTRPVSDYKTHTDAKGEKHRVPFEYNANFDWPYIFTALDAEFKSEIKEAHRRPGFYELKTDGRVEYRSLPANVDLDKVISVLKSILEEV